MTLELRLEPFEVTFVGAARDARGERHQTRGARLVLESATHAGCGELCPLPGRATVTLEDQLAALGTISPAALPSPEAVAPDATLEALGQAGALVPGDFAAARHALESALLDLLARSRALSAPELLARALGNELPREALPLAALVDAADVVGALAQAQSAAAAGITTFKLKISGAESDAAIAGRVAALREEFGATLRLRLDANQSLTAGRACGLLELLTPANLEYVEDPLPLAELEQLGDLGVPLAADEWLSDREFELERERQRGVSVVVLKPMVLGLVGALRLAQRAARAGVHVVLSHAFDGPWAMAASRSLALALGKRVYADGLAPHAALAAWDLAKLPVHVRAPSLVSWNHPGFGLEVS